MDSLITFAAFFGLALLVWDCVEVGRNDAANLVNAVFGARVMKRRRAVWLAGLAEVVGAVFSSAVMETARKGVFTPGMLDELLGDMSRWGAITIYISVYLVDTVLLYTYSAFGMPVSTT
ncbi:MAG: inorganic phosphate transporter, partial [Candidatus Omnitrophica bacterium]|nr:inorganic phosphate transporter [Candidatus Omnitrophota bacterium]